MISKILWGNIIKDFQKRRYRNIIQRDVHYPLDTPLDRAVVLSGPRRSGKTYLMYMGVFDYPPEKVKQDEDCF